MLDLLSFNPSHLWLSFEKSLQSNQFLASGLVLGGVGIVISLARSLPKKIGLFLFERCILSVQLIEPDDSFTWFQAWLFEQPVRLRMRDLAMATVNRHGHYTENEVKESNVGFALSMTQSDAPRGIFAPRKGTFHVEFEGRTFWVTADTNERSTRRPSISFTIRTLVTNRDAFERLMQAAYQTVFKPEEKRVKICVPQTDCTDWQTIQQIPPRDPKSLVYSNGIFEFIHADMQRFLESELWYTNMGIPWRRGYLLHGPSGNGKSSLVPALAGLLHKSVCVLNLAAEELTDSGLSALLSTAPEGSFILLEDIDVIFAGRNQQSRSKVSFNGLLNALDGVAAQQGRMIFMTTNHLDKLDPALIRPGRCDVHLFIEFATCIQIQAMLKRFYPTISDAHILAARLPENTLSMARVQDFLLQHRDDIEALRAAWWQLETTDALVDQENMFMETAKTFA